MTEETGTNYTEIFEANGELSEDEIIMAFYGAEDNELTIKECQSEYRRIAVEKGLIKTPNQRKAEWEDSIEDLDIADIDGYSAAKAAAIEQGISGQTATKYLKARAAEAGIELPELPTREANGTKWGEIVEGFDKDEALEGDREEVIAKINALGEYNDLKKAATYYNKLRKSFGWVAPEAMSTQLCNWYKDMYARGEDVTNDAIIEKSLEIGMTKGSAKYYVGVFKLTGEILDFVA